MAGHSNNFNLRIPSRGESLVRCQYTHLASTKLEALVIIWLILMRGHGVKMANVAGQFVVIEQVLS